MTRQTQRGGDGSTLVQAETINCGITYSDAKQIALDVFNDNALILKEEAMEVFHKRAEEFTDMLIASLYDRYPEALESFNDPDMQYSIFNAQITYGRTGDKEVGNILVDILSDRAKETERDLKQIVLNECIKTVPKLARNHFDILAVLFILKHTLNRDVNNLDKLVEYIEHYLLPFVNNISSNESDYLHLTYAGCGTINISSIKLEQIFLKNYSGLFCKGFALDEWNNITTNPEINERLLIHCLHNKDLFQVNALNEEVLDKIVSDLKISESMINSIKTMFKSNLMSENEVNEYLISSHQIMLDLFSKWDTTPLDRINLSSVGIAIGHAFTRTTINFTTDLSIWI